MPVSLAARGRPGPNSFGGSGGSAVERSQDVPKLGLLVVIDGGRASRPAAPAGVRGLGWPSWWGFGPSLHAGCVAVGAGTPFNGHGRVQVAPRGGSAGRGRGVLGPGTVPGIWAAAVQLSGNRLGPGTLPAHAPSPDPMG